MSRRSTSSIYLSSKDVDARHKAGHDDSPAVGLAPAIGKTAVTMADSQGSLPKTAATPYLDDNAAELSLCRGLLPAASLC
jgi:hypothetical protein